MIKGHGQIKAHNSENEVYRNCVREQKTENWLNTFFNQSYGLFVRVCECDKKTDKEKNHK